MTDRSTLCAPQAVTLDWLLGPSAEADEGELVSAVVIALCTDRRSQPSDSLPNQDSDDRRGWWGDQDADTLHDGWPIGSRLWLLERAKITGAGAREGSTIARIETYCREALQSFKDKRIVSQFRVQAAREGVEQVGVSVILYRGNSPDIELRFQDLWRGVGG